VLTLFRTYYRWNYQQRSARLYFLQVLYREI